jgi:hypothetical protein
MATGMQSSRSSMPYYRLDLMATESQPLPEMGLAEGAGSTRP